MAELNFLERRRILKKTNFLDLTPVRTLEHESRENGTVDLLMPRFRNKYWSRMFQPKSKSEFIRIKLDQSGSLTWLMIDGNTTVTGICEKLEAKHTGQFNQTEETLQRVTKFLSMLYQQRYITFREIQGHQ